MKRINYKQFKNECFLCTLCRMYKKDYVKLSGLFSREFKVSWGNFIHQDKRLKVAAWLLQHINAQATVDFLSITYRPTHNVNPDLIIVIYYDNTSHSLSFEKDGTVFNPWGVLYENIFEALLAQASLYPKAILWKGRWIGLEGINWK